MATILNGKNIPLNTLQGTVPDLSGAMTDWFQQITFIQVQKTVVNYRVVEVPTTIVFIGLIMPFSGRDLSMVPEGQRSWNWSTIYSQSVLPLVPDDVVTYLGKQMRIMSQKDYSIYGYYEYTAVIDYTGSGP